MYGATKWASSTFASIECNRTEGPHNTYQAPGIKSPHGMGTEQIHVGGMSWVRR